MKYLTALIDWLSGSYAAQAVLLSSIIATLRVLYDNSETSWKRIGLEASLCGTLTLAASQGLAYWNLPQQVAIVFGAALAFIGIEEFRKIMRVVARKKMGVDDGVQE